MDPEVAHAWRRITAGRGRLGVGDLPAEYGWSRARLWRRFTAQVGLSPKRAAMVVRLEHAMGALAAGTGTASVAAGSGYADQSHLTREVVGFTGRTPGELRGDPLWVLDQGARGVRFPH